MGGGALNDMTTGDEERKRSMGALVVTEFVTLDGVMEGPGGVDRTDCGVWCSRSIADPAMTASSSTS